MNQNTVLAGLIAAIVLIVAACGNADVDPTPDGGSGALDGEVAIDIADLPDDFPQELLSPEYDKASYADLRHINGTRGTTFEKTANVEKAIDYYRDLLGEPTINVDSGDGDRLVQWNESQHPPWVVGVMGRADETMITVSTLPEQ